MTAWEYCLVQVSGNRILLSRFQVHGADQTVEMHRSLPGLVAELGSHGWELVSIAVREPSIDADISSGAFGSQLLYFKRPGGYAD